MTTMLKAALVYADRLGYSVGPAHEWRNGRCTCGKGASCTNPGKHPRWMAGFFEHGLNSATMDPEIITALFTRFSNANIFMRPAPLSAVLDIDPRSGGDDSLAELEIEHGALPETVICLTGGGGTHYHFRSDEPVKGTTIAPGVEIKGPEQLLILPPSLHKSGNRYEWDALGHPFDIDPAPLPTWLKALARRREGAINPPGWAADWLRTPIQPGGGRRGPDGLPKIVGYLRGHGIESDVAVEIVRLWDLQNPEPLGEDAIREHVEGMYRRYGIPERLSTAERGVLRVA